MKRAVILGGGTGGTLVANRLRRHIGADELEIIVVDHFGLENNDLIPQVDHSITVGEFYERAAGGQIIFT